VLRDAAARSRSTARNCPNPSTPLNLPPLQQALARQFGRYFPQKADTEPVSGGGIKHVNGQAMEQKLIDTVPSQFLCFSQISKSRNIYIFIRSICVFVSFHLGDTSKLLQKQRLEDSRQPNLPETPQLTAWHGLLSGQCSGTKTCANKHATVHR
jgi:hypothetical protein